VLLRIEDYCKLSGIRENILDMLAMPGVDEIEFEPPRLSGKLFHPADLS
jgi:hypothetical protein